MKEKKRKERKQSEPGFVIVQSGLELIRVLLDARPINLVASATLKIKDQISAFDS